MNTHGLRWEVERTILMGMGRLTVRDGGYWLDGKPADTQAIFDAAKKRIGDEEELQAYLTLQRVGERIVPDKDGRGIGKTTTNIKQPINRELILARMKALNIRNYDGLSQRSEVKLHAVGAVMSTRMASDVVTEKLARAIEVSFKRLRDLTPPEPEPQAEPKDGSKGPLCAKTVRSLIHNQRINQALLAERAGLNVMTISTALANQRCTLLTAKLIAKALDVSVSRIRGEI